MTYLNIGQDHEAQWSKVGDNEEAGVIHLWIDLSCGKKKMYHHFFHKSYLDGCEVCFPCCLYVPLMAFKRYFVGKKENTLL